MWVALPKALMAAKPTLVARSFPRSSLRRSALAVSSLCNPGGCGGEQYLLGGRGSEGIPLMHPSIRLGCQKIKPLPSLSEERLSLPA